MPDLSEALDAALRDYYPSAAVQGVKTPATQRRGYLTRMNHIEKLIGAKGAAAKAAGIPARTWRDWRTGTHPPSARMRAKLEAAYDRLLLEPKRRKELRKTILGKGAPETVTVGAVIKWGKSGGRQYNNQQWRRTTLRKMGPAMRAVVQHWFRHGATGLGEVFERATSAVHREPDDDNGSPGIQFEGNQVEIDFQ